MGDEDTQKSGEDHEPVGARIRALSDEQLSYYFRLLADDTIVRNAQSLPLIEMELRRRGLPGGEEG